MYHHLPDSVENTFTLKYCILNGRTCTTARYIVNCLISYFSSRMPFLTEHNIMYDVKYNVVSCWYVRLFKKKNLYLNGGQTQIES